MNTKTALGQDCKRVNTYLILMVLFAVLLPSMTHASEIVARRAQIIVKLDAMAALLKPAAPAGQYEAQIREIQQKLDATPFVYTDVMSAIRNLENQVKRIAPVDRSLLFDLAMRHMLAEITLVKQGRDKGETTLSWQRGRISFTASQLLKEYPDQWPKPFLILLNEFSTLFDQYEKEDCDQVIALAKSGWSLPEFHFPDGQQQAVLKEKGLYPVAENTSLKNALKAYYESIPNTRKVPTYVEILEALIDDPGNTELRENFSHAFYAHLKTLDLSDVKKITSQMLIPDMIWSQVPENIASAQMSDERYRRMELATYLYQDSQTVYAKEQMRWEDVLRTYDMILKHYPHQGALVYRSYTQLFKGKNKEAFEDMALSVGMSAYSRSRIFNKKMAPSNDWYFNGIPMVMVMADLAYDNYQTDPPFPSGAFIDMMQMFHRGKWFAVAEYAGSQIKDFVSGASPDVQIANEMRYNNGIKEKMLDALADAVATARDVATKQKYIQWADALTPSDYPAFDLIKIRQMGPAKAKEKLERQLNWIAYDSMFDPAMNIEYAKILEKEGKLDDAMLCYNVASQGKPIAELDGIRKAAAENRNRLEGTSDQKAIAQRYLELIGSVQAKAKDRSSLYVGNAQLVMVINRLTHLISLNETAYLMQTDAYRALKLYPQANDGLKVLINGGKAKNVGLLQTLIGLDCYLMGEWSEAISALNDAMGKEGQPDLAYYYRGAAYRQLGDMPQAIKDYTKMLELDPENLLTLDERSKIYQYILNENAKALADLEKYKTIQLKKNPKFKSFTIDARLYNLKRERVFGK